MSMFSHWKHFTPPSAETEARVESLLSQLTLDEKLGLLGGQHKYVEGVERIGLPGLIMSDGPMGVHWFCDAATAYPCGISLAASWDVDLAERVGHAIGRDARAHGVHCLLGPGMNMYRSAFCGRNFEYLGEDPVLAGKLAAAYVRGCQDEGVATTIKHFAVNFQEYSRHQISSDVDERTLREVYLPAFETAIKEGGSAAVMTAYNLVNGIHCSEHAHLIKDILKGEWAFDGLVMSDWSATYDGVGATLGGQDLEMPTALFMNPETLRTALKDGEITEAHIDDKIRRRLRLAVCFGWIDHTQEEPGVPDADPVTIAVALEAARAGCVLLKNEKQVLPLDFSQIKKLAVIGPHAHPLQFSGGGSARPSPACTTSILDALKTVAGDKVEILHERGTEPWAEKSIYHSTEYLTPDGTPGLHAEYFDNNKLEGEPVTTRIDDRVDFHWGGDAPAEGVPQENFSVRWTGIMRTLTGGPHTVYTRVGDGCCRIWVNEKLILDTWDSQQDGPHLVTIDLPDHGLIPVQFEYRAMRAWCSFHVGADPVMDNLEDLQEAVQVATDADAAIVCVGMIEQQESEGYDRPFGLLAEHELLIKAVAEVNPRTIVVLTGGGNIDLRNWLDEVPGLLHIWYPGQEGGTAVAEILSGAVNPSGRLPATFEVQPEDRSSYDNYWDTDGDLHVEITDGVFFGYRHHDQTGIEPAFPFGFGLSYTDFAYENLSLSAETLAQGESLTVSFDIINTGTQAGADVAQLYLGDVECTLPRPAKELKSFAKVHLQPGERKTVQLTLNDQHLSFYVPKAGWTVEPGTFNLFIGRHARDVQLQTTFERT